MKNSTIILLFTFVLFSVSTACNTTSSEVEAEYTPGEVIIALEDGIEEADIVPRIEEFELQWKEYFENIGYALIGVPVGEEELWVEKLKQEPMIRNAQLNRKVELRGSS
ncbi:hypothetical protein DYD21_09045 [Rhodohalobacter sp. SW132]|uniref:S8 family serine peptidase n=1 Tax=Rhodohalobacter sp. SW132 TaxID=2293433 RepID=UPI000E24AA5F|nr:hypothetical protein [Rhodohalobacter sp. SW132]REL33550.1 hypothetical protein DYD21_09045 [Rhodohalobacter sp. SW132]